MAHFTIRIEGEAKLEALHTEEDFRAEAKRLLPSVARSLGEAAGEHAHKLMQDSFRKVKGFKVNNSQADRRKFIRDAGDNYLREMTAEDRQGLEDHIVAQLKEQKGI